MIVFAVINGVFALFGANTVHWNGQAVTGIAGLIASPFIGAFIAGMFCVFGWFAITIGLWLNRFVSPSFRIDYDPLPVSTTASDQASEPVAPA
jgi:Na+/H+-dicarboxylate symporter